MNWIRVAIGIGDDPDIHNLADALDVPVSQAVGLVVCTLAHFPEHAPDGNLAQLRDSLIERWAGWEGPRGHYAEALRRIFLKDGVWTAWEKHNGSAMRDATRARERAAEYRRRNAEQLLESSANGSPNGSPNGTAYGTVLRTNERTNITTAGRKRLFHTELAPYKPDPFCKVCGGGMGKADESETRLTIQHKQDCPDAS
jgi:hypothetical protein